MNEFEVLQYFQSGFQQNASYLLVVTILICLNFYLIRRARETNMPSYGKAIKKLQEEITKKSSKGKETEADRKDSK